MPDTLGVAGAFREEARCLRCIDLDDLEYLPEGNTLLTRRLKAKSTRYAAVVRFSRTRRRYERQGLLCQIASKCDPLFAAKNDPFDGAETGGAEPHIAEQSRSWRAASGERAVMRGS
jgi:hypothetical protein